MSFEQDIQRRLPKLKQVLPNLGGCDGPQMPSSLIPGMPPRVATPGLDSLHASLPPLRLENLAPVSVPSRQPREMRMKTRPSGWLPAHPFCTADGPPQDPSVFNYSSFLSSGEISETYRNSALMPAPLPYVSSSLSKNQT